jgi:hypothetical protein
MTADFEQWMSQRRKLIDLEHINSTVELLMKEASLARKAGVRHSTPSTRLRGPAHSLLR